ncbi:MAG: LysM peptidoglycan-binding domain-containing protein, partial [Candidatus Brocadiia bacterium]
RPQKTVELFKVPERVIPADKNTPGSEPAIGPEPVKPLDMPKTNKPALERFYVIEKGDTLSVIAEKFYGAGQTNLHGNIEKIYQANRNTLKSKNDIQFGQKLVIPSLTDDRTAAKSSSVLESNIFEKVESIGIKRLFSGNIKPPSAPPALRQVPTPVKERSYTVRGGESLWGIAEKQLGDGSRYKEIIKLNGGVLKDGNTVEAGTKLNLPAK